MVYINSLGTTELFTGAYNKRVEQNKSKVGCSRGPKSRTQRHYDRKGISRQFR